MPNTTPDMIGYRLLQRVLLGCAALIVLVVLLLFGLALDKSRARCEDVQDIRAYALASAQRGLRATPTVAYYKTHPDELAAAMAALREQRDRFEKPLRCSLI